MALIPTGNAWSLCDSVWMADWGVMEMEATDFTCKYKNNHVEKTSRSFLQEVVTIYKPASSHFNMDHYSLIDSKILS
jgi:hypothetical protein